MSEIMREEKYVFFFFQAEDGIRDYKVTGVQTCALPISTQAQRASTYYLLQGDAAAALRRLDFSRCPTENEWDAVWRIGLSTVAARSEERRVGKECRSRWSPYH